MSLSPPPRNRHLQRLFLAVCSLAGSFWLCNAEASSLSFLTSFFGSRKGKSKKGDVTVCQGEGDRYVDQKCNHDQTHRVCAQLVKSDSSNPSLPFSPCTPLMWGDQNFWNITGQSSWEQDICANDGTNWCICMWATATLISNVGCENVHLDCSATDVAYVMQQYTDGGTNLAPAKTCLEQKCPAAVAAATSTAASLLASAGAEDVMSRDLEEESYVTDADGEEEQYIGGTDEDDGGASSRRRAGTARVEAAAKEEEAETEMLRAQGRKRNVKRSGRVVRREDDASSTAMKKEGEGAAEAAVERWVEVFRRGRSARRAVEVHDGDGALFIN
eukprot:CAMPEP_0178991904 /NCGR_PEP_ID=MMETSP0795-20121207/5801_1 /TAXON_ID=88552 /ORGANISM="Amoebophrya sp., Strain Ameob2" /LENGTH=329 /DNA_ID=CAMNT_0020683693 /DNA_START=115 /DNA_END=1105 /DNA_ORIENTATION=+